MHKHVNTFNGLTANQLLTIVTVLSLLMVACCKQSASKDAATDNMTLNNTEYYHADNDIAMTVRSIVDAIKVGEPIDSLDYDFKGVLTDGQGSPLYTDIQGAPGMWVVDVLDTKNVTIKNLYLGDLLPGDLQNYIVQSLQLSDDQQLTFTVSNEAVQDDEMEINLYDFGGGYLRFEIRAGIAPNGIEGPLLTIFMSKELPSSIIPDSAKVAGIRKDALTQNVAKP